MDLATKEIPPSNWVLTPDLKHLTIFGELSKSGVIGDPTLSSPQKGEAMINKAIEDLSEFVVKFKQMDVKLPRQIQHVS
jgi:creatinine amidohydrolase/Fe(II)-dependent formamide hydrolase-like protein